jgi:hypothetical protein
MARGVAAGLLMALVLAGGAAGQTIAGTVLEEGTQRPVSTALVRLVDRDGDLVRDVLADTLGRFRLAPPAAGEYYLEARRIGYEEWRSPLLALEADGTVAMDVLVRPLPVGLEGFEVTAQRRTITKRVERELRYYGLDPAALGRRLITREMIAAPPFKRDFSSILTWIPVPGLKGSGGEGASCYRFQRGVSLSGINCAVIVLNGVEASREILYVLDPEMVERLAVLTPSEARILYGIRGDAGAIMIWTSPPPGR